jgi:alpha-D-ribose 1-methylphosphonate 5-triphosphate diphosphatase PhnM
MAKESNISSILPISPENIKIAEYFVIGIVLFLFFRGQIRKSRQAKQYGQAGTDVNTSHAIQVRQACNPSGVGLMIEFDGTWDNDLMLVADQIGDPDEVAKAYLNLYNENMYERLEKELTSAKFQQWIQRAKAAPKAEQTSTTATMVKLVAVKDTTIWSDTDSSKAARKVATGDAAGTRLKAYYITNSAGKKNLYYLVGWTSFLFLYSQGLVLAADVKEA